MGWDMGDFKIFWEGSIILAPELSHWYAVLIFLGGYSFSVSCLHIIATPLEPLSSSSLLRDKTPLVTHSLSMLNMEAAPCAKPEQRKQLVLYSGGEILKISCEIST